MKASVPETMADLKRSNPKRYEALKKWQHNQMLACSGDLKKFEAWKWVWKCLECFPYDNLDACNLLAEVKMKLIQRDVAFFETVTRLVEGGKKKGDHCSP